MPIKRILSTTIRVSDADKAIDFYVNKLGFEKRRDEPFGMEGAQMDLRWIEVAPPGAETVIILAQGYGKEASELGTFSGIVLGSDDIYVTCTEMKQKGVHFVEEPQEQAWGLVQAIFHDQDENVLVIVGR